MQIQTGSRVALLSENCPEVVFFNLAAHVVGCTVTPLHPKGSFDDHAYVLLDAEIEALVFQPSNYEERVEKLSNTIAGVEHFLAFGPSQAGEDYSALAATFEPKPLVAPDVKPDGINNIVYTGGDNRYTQRRRSHLRINNLHDNDANGRVGYSFSRKIYGGDTTVSCRLYLSSADSSTGRLPLCAAGV